MNSRHKKSIGTLLALLALAGCDKGDLPHVFGDNEVPPEVLSERRVVTTPALDTVKNMDWKPLGDVPSAPKDFTSPTMIGQSMQEMQDDRAEAEKLRQAADMPPDAQR